MRLDPAATARRGARRGIQDPAVQRESENRGTGMRAGPMRI
ncbi:MAG: hypothetical protein QUS08_10215 [Methanothrix sp.]|nr:hypothetical protein [Methanothrix sp.]